MTYFSGRIGGLALAGLMGVCSANAADLYKGGMKDTPYEPVPTWTGFYVGLNAGGAWGNVDVTGFPSYGHSGFEGGAQFGGNWQRGPFVFGLEGDVGGFDIGAHKFGNSIESGFHADATARLGYAFGPALLYVKGGGAFYEGTVRVGGTPNTGDFWGGTIGGGLEYMVNPSWSLKAEYLYYDYGTQSVGAVDNDLTVSTVKFGVNLHFPPKIDSLK